MNQFQKMLDRVSVQNISSFFQMGSVQKELDTGSMEEREDKAVLVLEKRLQGLVPESCYRDALDAAMEYANDCCELYFAVGMKVGAMLTGKLLDDSGDDT